MEKWGFVDGMQLVWNYSPKLCMTCQHFGYGADAHCQTQLDCNFRPGLLEAGEHLIHCCERCSANTEMSHGVTVIA